MADLQEREKRLRIEVSQARKEVTQERGNSKRLAAEAADTGDVRLERELRAEREKVSIVVFEILIYHK